MQDRLYVPRRPLLYAILSLFSLAVLLAATVHVQERIFRYRSERLLEDFRSIELRHTRFEQVGDLAARWNGFASHGVPCSREYCDFAIAFREIRIAPSHPQLFRVALLAYRWLGAHAAGVSANFNVRNGFVWGETYQMAVDAPPTPYGEYTLMGEVSTQPKLELMRLIWPSLRRHPEYYVGGPSACLGCVAVWVRISPFVDSKDIRRLSQFNFSCLTRLRACRKQEDIMPAATMEANAEGVNRYEQPNCDLKATRIVSRVMDNAALVEVIVNRPAPRYPTDERRILKARLIERIKRTLFWEPDTIKAIEAPVALAVPPLNDSKNVRPGERVIILFNSRGVGVIPDIETAMCGVVPYSDANLMLVRDGAAQDDRVPPLIEYSDQYRPRKFSDPPGPPPPPLPSASGAILR